MGKDTTNTIQERIRQNKKAILEELKKTPIVQTACANAGVGRNTYYRWRKKDRRFKIKSDKVLKKGRSIMNDKMETLLLAQAYQGNMTAIIFWLKNNHPNYMSPYQLREKEVNKIFELGSE
jgi:hypothetical protein